ncbi:hypothetical protein G9A89_003995 [Geosiphon pyriformis]|nr:hypothetical protein G9A89_003995 [Geosiphon pyriformis]
MAKLKMINLANLLEDMDLMVGQIMDPILELIKNMKQALKKAEYECDNCIEKFMKSDKAGRLKELKKELREEENVTRGERRAGSKSKVDKNE